MALHGGVESNNSDKVVLDTVKRIPWSVVSYCLIEPYAGQAIRIMPQSCICPPDNCLQAKMYIIETTSSIFMYW